MHIVILIKCVNPGYAWRVTDEGRSGAGSMPRCSTRATTSRRRSSTSRPARLTLRPASTVRDVTIAEAIALGHKFALHAIAAGGACASTASSSAVLRATSRRARGCICTTSRRRRRRRRAEARRGRRATPPHAGMHWAATRRAPADTRAATFAGYRRPDGRVGVRNHVLVLSPTGLTSAAAQRVASLVRGTVCVATGYGRGQVGGDAQLQFDTLAGLAAHPNVAAVVVLSAADDITQPMSTRSRRGQARRRRCRCPACTRMRLRSSMPACAPPRGWCARRRRCGASRVALAELCVAVECGHSDATSGPRVQSARRPHDGDARRGGRTGDVQRDRRVDRRRAPARAARRERRTSRRRIVRRRRRARAHGARLPAATSARRTRARRTRPGGITTIEEKALGAIAKGGRQPIRGVLRAAERPRGPGLYPHGHAVLLARVDHGDGRRRRADRGVHHRRRQQLLQPRRADAQDERQCRTACARLTEQIDFAATGVLRRERDARSDGVRRRWRSCSTSRPARSRSARSSAKARSGEPLGASI